MFTSYWTKLISKLPSIRFTVSISAYSCTKVTGWAETKKWTLSSIPMHWLPLTQSLHTTVLSSPGLDYSSKEKDWQTALSILHSDESHSVKLSWLLLISFHLFFYSLTQLSSFISFTLLPAISPLQVSQCRRKGRRKILLSDKTIKILNPLNQLLSLLFLILSLMKIYHI